MLANKINELSQKILFVDNTTRSINEGNMFFHLPHRHDYFDTERILDYLKANPAIEKVIVGPFEIRMFLLLSYWDEDLILHRNETHYMIDVTNPLLEVFLNFDKLEHYKNIPVMSNITEKSHDEIWEVKPEQYKQILLWYFVIFRRPRFFLSFENHQNKFFDNFYDEISKLYIEFVDHYIENRKKFYLHEELRIIDTEKVNWIKFFHFVGTTYYGNYLSKQKDTRVADNLAKDIDWSRTLPRYLPYALFSYCFDLKDNKIFRNDKKINEIFITPQEEIPNTSFLPEEDFSPYLIAT